MERKRQIGAGRDMLEGMLALLLSLADLADRAAGAPRPVRWLLFWCLGQAVAVASGFVAGSVRGSAGAACAIALLAVSRRSVDGHANNPASSLRALALAVRAMIADLWSRSSFAGRAGAANALCGRQPRIVGRSGRNGRGTASCRVRTPDTS